MDPEGFSSYPPGEPGRYDLILETIPQLVWVAGADGAVEYLNRRCREYAGLPIDDMLGWDWGWVVHPSDLPTTLTLWNEAVRTGSDFHVEYRLRRHDSQYRWFEVRATALRDRDGQVVRWYGICHDINDFKRANLGLRNSQRLFRAFVERSDRGYALMGSDRIIRYVSPAVARILGYSPEDEVGLDGWLHAHPDDKPAQALLLAHILSNPGVEVETHLRVRHADGTYRRLAVQAINLIPDPDVRAVAVTFWEHEDQSPDVPLHLPPVVFS